jgi:hypothetical protein
MRGSPASLEWIGVAQQGAVRVLPDEHPEGELDTDPRITLHEWRSGSRVAEEHDLLSCQLQTRLPCRSGMIDLAEHAQAAPTYHSISRLTVSAYPTLLRVASTVPLLR